MNPQTSQNSVQPTVRNLRKNFLSLLLALAGFLAGGSVSFGTVAFDADFSTYNVGPLNGGNSWAQVSSATAIVNPIQVIAAAGDVPRSIKFTGILNVAQSYRDLPAASQFNPHGVTSPKTFYYVIENFRVIQAYISSGNPGAGNAVCTFASGTGGTGSFMSRLFIRRYSGLSANTTTF
jgi:hypothetical protein